MRPGTFAGVATCLLVGLAMPGLHAEESIPRGQLPDTVVPTRYELDLTIDPRSEGFSGETTIDVDVRTPTRTVWLHGLGLEITRADAVIDGRRRAGRFTIVEPITGVARLDFDEELPAGAATLQFSHSATYSHGAEGLVLAEAGDERYVFSQMQAIDARRVFPGFDEPRFKTPFDVTVRAANADQVITNAPLVAADRTGELVVHRFATTEPLPTYLLAFAVGPLDVVTVEPLPPNPVRGRPVPLRGVATQGQGPRLAFALAHTPFMVDYLEQYFGIAYPYAKLDLLSSPGMAGAMENAGAILYDDNLLLLGPDPTPIQRRGYGETHAHELAHQWFGDLVTPVWWDDIWLNESFAEWMGIKVAVQWDRDLGSEVGLTAAALETMTTDSLRAGRPIRQVVTDNTQIASTFDSITYLKGAGVLAMFESYLGDATFRDGVRLHLGRHMHGNATAQDFFAAIAEASDDDRIVGAFRSFVEQPGVPLVEVTRSADGGK
ncbi:MAG TPA: M1 family metallopeptidase, partial [Steroidobacteraceae bacterium]|nr:M1 family metallopeptidase [Steroidobacteraceae bacterium]